MHKFKLISLFILVQLPLVLAIYLGTSVLPEYMAVQQQHLKDSNYFLTSNKPIIKSPTEQDIADQCHAFLTSLETKYQTKLKTIAQEAYQEYQLCKAKDPNFSAYSLAGKYLGRVSALETECRQELDHYLATMETELKANHLSLTLIDQAKYAYQVRKEEIKKGFYSKAKEAL